jgi:transcription initiation factor TFIIIB Brf1 subunit/transcription initiation factor TFIIB
MHHPAKRARRGSNVCYHCEEENCIVADVSSGDVTCTACGTVQDERMIVDDLAHNGWCLESHHPMYGYGHGATHQFTQQYNNYQQHQSIARPARDLPATAPAATTHVHEVSAPDHVTPQFKHGVDLVNDFLEALGLQDSFVAVHAHDLRTKVMAALHFKARPFVAAMACCVYLACRDSKQEKVPRSAQEVMERLGIEAPVFNRVLKEILLKLPRETKQQDTKQHVKHTDGLSRQIQQLRSVPLDKTYVVARKAAELDVIRKQHRYMLATPPSHTNAVLITMACEITGIPLDLEELIGTGWIAASTLKKHVSAMKKWM